jgi:hypothetical protein
VRKATAERNKTVRRISGIENDMDDQDRSLLTAAADINKTNHESSNTPNTNSIVDGIKKNSNHHNVSPFMAFLIMVRRSFLMAWEFLTAITSVFFVTFIVFPGTSLHTDFHFMKAIDNIDLRNAW